jgi:hypothetical protein
VNFLKQLKENRSNVQRYRIKLVGGTQDVG